MELNPYATHLGQRNALSVIAGTPGTLHQLCCELTPEQIEAPWAPGKWSPREIAAHLADVELVFCFRLRQTLAPAADEAHATIQPFDQDRWASRYAAYDLPTALALFKAARAWNLKLVQTLQPVDFTRQVTHPERGTMTFQTLLETMAGHDLNHLAQVEAVAARSQSDPAV